jgi:hypothetical protein
MLEWIIPIAAYYLFFGNKKKSGVISGKYVPIKQPNFKEKLKPILKSLEKDLKSPGLYDFFMGVARIESRWFPSAIRYESTGYRLLFSQPNKEGKRLMMDKWKKNPWKYDKSLWLYTGGLFQIFPANALNTQDKVANNWDPRTVFDPYYQIAYCIDFASRLNLNHKADSWLKIRYGWNSLSVLYNYDNENYIEKAERVEDKIYKAILNNNGDPDILYLHQPDLFSYYRKNYKFNKLLEHIKSMS